MKIGNKIRSFIALSLTLISALNAPAQGPLTPPGPPGPTMKTLSQIEPRTLISSLPYTITASGSYYLAANLTGTSGNNGITVNASGVTIDLRGFSLSGVAGSQSGITVPSAQSGLIIQGGTIQGWGAFGINATNDSSCAFSQLILYQNTGSGLAAGPNSLVRDCVAAANSGDGLILTSSCLAEGNNCQTNTGNGIHVLGNASRVEGNHCGGNGSAGFRVDGSQNLIVKNSAANNSLINYNIAANNDYGPIYTSPGAGFTNSNPWANFGSGAAAAPTCTDGIQDGNETDIDCGGGTCPACAVGKHCNLASDCVSSVCSGGLCQASCTDGIKDGNETDVDCGGGTCPKCGTGKQCTSNNDCVSGVCSTGVCQANSCTDGIKDGNETDVDCGGGTCPTCAVGKGCLVNSDCTSGACDNVTGLCASSMCSDQKQDGAETDIDCGGGTCPTCAVGKKCQLDSDCASNACDGSSLLCVSSQCADHRKDGNETDVDCGGSNSCARCATGKACLVNSDCVSGHLCSGGVCN